MFGGNVKNRNEGQQHDQLEVNGSIFSPACVFSLLLRELYIYGITVKMRH